MNIKIRTKNISLNESLDAWVREKVNELKKFLGKFKNENEVESGRDKIKIEVEIGKISKHHKKGEVFRAELQLFLPRKKLRAVVKNIDLRTAIIEARDQLGREIKRYKGKRLDRARKWARRVKERIRTPRFMRKK
jgi:ribosomal subunit interface protein